MGINKLVAGIMGLSMLGYVGIAKIANAEEYNPKGFKTPDVKSARFIREKQKDIIDEIPGKETTLKVYKTKEGTYFNTLSIDGKLYGFYIDTDGKPPMEYTLADQKGDGVFRHKYIKEKWPMPDYLWFNLVSIKKVIYFNSF